MKKRSVTCCGPLLNSFLKTYIKFLPYVFRKLFNNVSQQIQFCQKNCAETQLLAKKMHNGQNAFEVLLYLTLVSCMFFFFFY